MSNVAPASSPSMSNRQGQLYRDTGGEAGAVRPPSAVERGMPMSRDVASPRSTDHGTLSRIALGERGSTATVVQEGRAVQRGASSNLSGWGGVGSLAGASGASSSDAHRQDLSPPRQQQGQREVDGAPRDAADEDGMMLEAAMARYRQPREAGNSGTAPLIDMGYTGMRTEASPMKRVLS